MGLDVDALEQELRRDPSPAFLYALPTFQNPSGRTLPLERRRRLVELASEHALIGARGRSRTGASASTASRCRR